jgi:hypothetical protein
VLGTAYRTISSFLLRRAGLTRTTGPTGAVTIVQRFRSALNLNVHSHLPFMDGVYLADGADPPEFRVECERRSRFTKPVVSDRRRRVVFPRTTAAIWNRVLVVARGQVKADTAVRVESAKSGP